LGGEASLIVARAREARRTDDIADRVDVPLLRSIELVDLQEAPAVDGEADRFEAEVGGVAGAALRPKKDLRLDLLAGLEVHDDAVVAGFDLLVLLVVANDDALIAEVVGEGVDDVV